MSANLEPSSWQREWQVSVEAPDAADLKSRIVRETRRMRIAMLGPTFVTVVAGGSVLQAAITLRRPEDIALAIGVWCFILIVWLGALWMARGTWRPAAETTSAFLRLSILRCRSTLRGIYFGAALYVAGFLSVIGWRHYYASMDLYTVLTSLPVILFAVLITPAVFSMLWFLANRKRVELHALLEVQRQLEEL